MPRSFMIKKSANKRYRPWENNNDDVVVKRETPPSDLFRPTFLPHNVMPLTPLGHPTEHCDVIKRLTPPAESDLRAEPTTSAGSFSPFSPHGAFKHSRYVREVLGDFLSWLTLDNDVNTQAQWSPLLKSTLFPHLLQSLPLYYNSTNFSRKEDFLPCQCSRCLSNRPTSESPPSRHHHPQDMTSSVLRSMASPLTPPTPPSSALSPCAPLPPPHMPTSSPLESQSAISIPPGLSYVTAGPDTGNNVPLNLSASARVNDTGKEKSFET
ncbi:uncharacterized protein LOC106013666 [Aplysia californica]|uniref:Uncharacterized protein LOC106013666 n=1 Tax=Aplysia californica TaxID=6500 RepID=A0ABM1AD67_APLCA|nr:uncharacterized protein LOC106013666 [Aplysia californica]